MMTKIKLSDQDIIDGAIVNVAEQIMDSGCTSGRQTILDDNGKEHDIYWELTINILD